MFLYYEAVSKLMLDVHNQSAPINIVKLFTKTSHIHTYNTRSSKSQLLMQSTLDLTYKKRPSHVLVSKFGIRYRMNLKANVTKNQLKFEDMAAEEDVVWPYLVF